MRSKVQAVRRKKLMMAAFLILLIEVVGIVLVNSLRYGLHLDWTISRYVGLETWSAVVFGVGNLVAMPMMLYYLYEVGESWRMRRGFYVLVVLVVIMLVGVSVCPLGYFDTATEVSIVSHIHHLCSRSMFALMALLALTGALCRQAATNTRVCAGIFAVGGVICAVAFLTGAGWFYRFGLVFETAYLLGFMGWCLGCQTKLELIENVKKGEKNE